MNTKSNQFLGDLENVHGIKFGTVRPTQYTFRNNGAIFFDETLGKPIWYNGTNWIDATGAIV